MNSHRFAAPTISRRFLPASASLASLGVLASLQAASFSEILPPGATESAGFAVSPDGLTVAGTYRAAGVDAQGFRWTAVDGVQPLPDLPGGSMQSESLGVSEHGLVAVGRSSGTAGLEAVRWPFGAEPVLLGTLAPNRFFSIAHAVSWDGAVIVGRARGNLGDEAFRWTQAGGMVGLGDLRGGGGQFQVFSEARAVSWDGSMVAGTALSNAGTQAFRWTAANGMTGLGDLPGGTFESEAFGISADGSTVVGRSRSDIGGVLEAFRWTEAEGMTGLGDLPGGPEQSEAFAASGNGAIVVGRGRTAAVTTYEAFLWDKVGGMRNLREELIAKHGLATVLNGWILNEARAISPDGLTIVGTGTHAGKVKAWIAQLDPPPPDLSIVPIMPVVELDKLVYDPGEAIHVRVRFRTAAEAAATHGDLELTSPDTGDVEILTLLPTADPLVLEAADPPMLSSPVAGAPALDDGFLSAAPNEVFVAMYGYELPESTLTPGAPWMAADFGIVYDPDFALSPVSIEPSIAMSEDELDPPPGMRPVGTLLIDGGTGVSQVAREEVLFHAENDAELDRFLALSGGTLLEDDRLDINDVVSWRRIAVTPDPAALRYLDQLRGVVDDPAALVASNEETLALYANALEWWLQGFRVALNPRAHLFGPLRQLEGVADRVRVDYMSERNHVVPSVWDPIFGLRRSWAFMEMFDLAGPTVEIPVAFIDQGFAPNPDFRGFPTLHEVDMASGRSGPGEATGKPTVNNSFFGDKSWHGSGVVAAAGAVANNSFGVAGTGGYVVRPMLYEMGLREYAFGIGLAIRRAASDGAAIINLSAGYPCRVLWTLGPDSICSATGRAVFFAKITAVVTAAARATCAAAAAILPFGGRLICRVTIAHFVGRADPETIRVLLESVFAGGLRGPVEDGVAFATSRGVPVVTNAGNRIDDDDLGFLDRFINNENYNVDDWEIIPAVLPEVICAGAATAYGWDQLNSEHRNFFRNLHFWGNAVDLWAPIPTLYFAPETVDLEPEDVPSRDHVRHDLGGTSAAAPFIAGVLANMMAANPSLNPLLVPPAERPALPRALRDMIVDTAHRAGDPGVPSTGIGLNLVDPDTGALIPPIDWPLDLFNDITRRRNLIDCFEALRAAGRDVFPDYEALGYQTDYGMTDDVRDYNPTNVVDGYVNSADGLMFSEEISRGDRDSWRFGYATTAPGLFQSRLRLFIPVGEDPAAVRVNGRPVVLTSSGPEEHILEWLAPQLFSSGTFPVAIHAEGEKDFLYRLEVDPMIVTPPPPPDSTDVMPGLGDNTETAIPVGEGTDCPWLDIPVTELEGGLEASASQICKEDLNFHSASDEDWFFVRLPADWHPADCLSPCRPKLRIEIVPPSSIAEIEVRGSDRDLIKRGYGNHPLELACHEYFGRFPLLVGVRNSGRAFLEYALKIRWSAPDPEACAHLDRIRDAHAESDPGGIDWFEPIDPDLPFLGGSGLVPPRFVNPPLGVVYPRDAFGRILRAQPFLIRLHTAGDFEVRAALRAGASLRMELFDLQGNLLATALTPDLDPQAPPQPLERVAIALPNLQAGSYIMAVSGYRPGDVLDLMLTRNAIHDDSPALDDYGLPQPNVPLPTAGPQPEPPTFPELVPELQGDDRPFGLYMLPVRYLAFNGLAGRAYRAELKVGDDWLAYGYPIASAEVPARPFEVAMTQIPGATAARVRELGGAVVEHTEAPGLEFQFPTTPGTRGAIERSTNISEWQEAIEVFGDGTVLRERFRLDQVREFFRGRSSPE